jgi:plastocyanin
MMVRRYQMLFRGALLLVLALGVGMAASLAAQVRSSDPNIAMMDNCSEADPGYADVGGCPEGAPFPGFRSYGGDVSVAEFFSLLTSSLAPGHVIGHPSWRNQPSYLSIALGQTVRVTNSGGRVHTFTEVQEFGGGFVPLLNEEMEAAPECGADFVPDPDVVFVGVGQTQTLSLQTGLHKFQCCIHPWMRGAVRVN